MKVFCVFRCNLKAAREDACLTWGESVFHSFGALIESLVTCLKDVQKELIYRPKST